MSKFGQVMKYLSSEISHHGPAILTGLGIAGMIGTIVLAVRATPEAMERIEEEEAETPIEKVKAAWTCYIPTAVTGTTSIACLIAAHKVNSNRIAALATAYSIKDTAFKEYKDKVTEKLGEKKEKEIRDEINRDRLERELKENPDPPPYRMMTNGKMPCYDATLGFEFIGNEFKLKEIQNTLNDTLKHQDYVSVTEYRDMLENVRSATIGTQLGWNSMDGLIDFDISYQTINGLTYLVVSYDNNVPKYDYNVYSS